MTLAPLNYMACRVGPRRDQRRSRFQEQASGTLEHQAGRAQQGRQDLLYVARVCVEGAVVVDPVPLSGL